jgi:hypothetical protein
MGRLARNAKGWGPRPARRLESPACRFRGWFWRRAIIPGSNQTSLSRIRFSGLTTVRQHRHNRIVTQFVVVADVLIAQRDPKHPLTHQGRNTVLDQILRASVDEALGKTADQPDPAIRRPQQQGSSVRRDRSAIKASHNFAPSNRCKFKQVRATLCWHRGIPRIEPKSFSQNNFR